MLKLVTTNQFEKDFRRMLRSHFAIAVLLDVKPLPLERPDQGGIDANLQDVEAFLQFR